MSFKELVRSLHTGEREILDYALQCRVSSLECQKETNAFLQVFLESEISEQCQRAKALMQAGSATALTGVPIAIKENILVRGHRASAGSRMLDSHVALYDAHVVEELKDAGAILIGTTNLDEFAMGSSSETSYYGAVSNPLDASRVPGGSSGGSAAAVAFGAVPLALGTDTGGSVRQPAAFCGVVGFKPSYGKISRHGVVAFASSLDQVGVFARDVLGVAAVTEVIEGLDQKDATTEAMSPLSLASLLSESTDLTKLRIALLKETRATRLDSVVSTAWNSTQKILSDAGAAIKEVSAPAWTYALEAYYLVCCSEASSNLARYDGVRYGHRAAAETLDDLYAKSRREGFGIEVRQRILLGTLALSTGYFEAYFKKAAQVRALLVSQLERLFETSDVIMMPTTPTVAFASKTLSTGTLEMYENDIFTVGVNLAGLPAVSIPVSVSGSKLPAGIQFIGKRGSDLSLLRMAHRVKEILS